MASAAWANALLAGGENIRGIGRSLMDLSIQRERERREREDRAAAAQYRADTLAESRRHNREQELNSRLQAFAGAGDAILPAAAGVNVEGAQPFSLMGQDFLRIPRPTTQRPAFDPATDPELLREQEMRRLQLGRYSPEANIGTSLLDQTRQATLQDRAVNRAQEVVRNLANAGQPYGEVALHPDVKGRLSPDEIRGIYESQKRAITAANTVQQGRELTNANRAAPDDDAALMAALLGGEQPQQTGMRIPNPVARSGAMAQERKPLQDRVAELKAQGISKEEARAILMREGYPIK